ncbi:MAG: adenylosuccinate synthase [Tunicatimonas sp.]
MNVDVLLGLQWGDEGKGKIVDYLAPNYQVVARFQGGPNAGHTLEFDDVKHVLHQIPSGVFRAGVDNIIGNGVVLDPIVLHEELENLKPYGLALNEHLYISKKAQLILPTHRLLDAAYEQSKGKDKIGSTLRGIGPTYQDKVGRIGLRVGDALSANFEQQYDALKAEHEKKLSYYQYEYNLSEAEEKFWQAIDLLRKMKLVDSEYLINQRLQSGTAVLAEGAQGSLLDIDFGNYPFVTSSTTTAAGACTGLGVAPRHIGEVFGIFKAYCTRVGSGPFVTELNDATGEFLRAEGHEFGATTGRPRRCGWLDIPALKYAATINGATQLFMMKADVLNRLGTLQVCTKYRLPDGSEVDYVPFEICDAQIKPIYKEFKGWKTDLEGQHDFSRLPTELLHYIDFIEEAVGVPINIVSVGPNRSETIIKSKEALA